MAKTTQYYAIPQWEDDDLADVEATINITADVVDQALHDAVLECNLAAARIESTERHMAFLLMGA